MKRLIILSLIPFFLTACKSVEDEFLDDDENPTKLTQTDLVELEKVSAAISHALILASDYEFLVQNFNYRLPGNIEEATSACPRTEIKDNGSSRSQEVIGPLCPFHSVWSEEAGRNSDYLIRFNNTIHLDLQNQLPIKEISFQGRRVFSSRRGVAYIDTSISKSKIKLGNTQVIKFESSYTGAANGVGEINYTFATRIRSKFIKATISNGSYGFINGQQVTPEYFASHIPIIR
jgi:hypothetical protein